MNNIPKVIHYCWFGGNEKPEIVKKCIQTWKKKMPEYTIIEWNEENFDISKFKFTNSAYKFKKWAFVADYCRLWVLYNYGGIYLDTDMEILKPLDSFLNEKSFTGVEDHENIAFGIWGCKKDDKFIKEILDYYEQIDFNSHIEDLFKIAIPKVITEVAKQIGYIPKIGEIAYFGEEVAVYPTEVFYPKKSSWAEAIITENTYTIHHYEGSWRSPMQIFKSKLKKKLINIIRSVKGKECV